MAYELWDIEYGNLIADFSTEDEALAVVRKAIEVKGPDFITRLALGCEDDSGDSHPIAAGAARAQRAIAVR